MFFLKMFLHVPVFVSDEKSGVSSIIIPVGIIF